MQNAKNFYINGIWTNPEDGRDFSVIDPSTEEVIGAIALGGLQDTIAAVSAAKAAFSEWASTTKAERLDLLQNILSIYSSRSEELASAISKEMGAPIDMARIAQAAAGSEHLIATIAALDAFDFERPLRPDNKETLIAYEPIGVCALITPWNWPVNQIALKVFPALAAGCTMVLKPSEQSPFSAIIFAEILDEAGVPSGVFNMLNGDGAGVGSQLCAHDDIDMVSFTGSTRAGIEISKTAADTIKRVSLELGGKGANIIFADAAPDAVVQGALRCFRNTGQSCNAPTRMLVERSRYDAAVEDACRAANDTKANLAALEGQHIGPLASAMQFAKVQEMIQRGIDDGARLVAGGIGRPKGLNRRFFAQPTVFADCTNDMIIMRDEIFGPVLAMMPFDTEEEAIAIANDTVYGLTNYVQTANPDRARRVARKLRSGMVDINGKMASAGAPFGGMKQSGNGREGGVWGIEEFLEVKAITGWPSD